MDKLGMKLGEHARFKPIADDEGPDRITIDPVPRYKTSGLSGDEWRMSYVVRFYRRGRLRSAHSLQGALGLL